LIGSSVPSSKILVSGGLNIGFEIGLNLSNFITFLVSFGAVLRSSLIFTLLKIGFSKSPLESKFIAVATDLSTNSSSSCSRMSS
jgi:hypothetical protein